MTKVQKDQIDKALAAYTKSVTITALAARQALEREGIYNPDGTLTPEYKAASAA